jgi:8-oxo-dGTP diphosphatase
MTARRSGPSRPTTGGQRPTTRRQPPLKRVVAGLLLRDGKLLICQRTEDQALPLKWEFPGGKIEPGERARQALARELDEELGIQATIGAEVARVRHTYRKGNTVELRFFLVTRYTGAIENRIFREVRWAERASLPDYDFLDADRGLVRDIAAGKLL